MRYRGGAGPFWDERRDRPGSDVTARGRNGLPGVDRFEAASSGGTDDFYAADGTSGDVDHIAGGEDGGFAIERDFDDAGDHRVDSLPALGLGGDDGARPATR